MITYFYNLNGDKMKITDRKFGIEIEAFGVSTYRVQDALRAAGLNAEVEGYNHITRSHWKITSDASINGRNAFELVSPILQGQNGLRQLKKACANRLHPRNLSQKGYKKLIFNEVLLFE